MVKNPLANSGDSGFIPGSGRSPGGGNGNPLQHSCLGNPMDRSLVGYSPWGHKTVEHDIVTKTMKDLPKATKRLVTDERRFITSNQQNEGLQWTSVSFCLGG